MSRATATSKSETFTFRLDTTLKAALTKSAVAEHKQPAALMRELVRDHIVRQERQVFEEEARRQCLALNARAKAPGTFTADMRWFEDGKVLLKPLGLKSAGPALAAGAGAHGGVK